mgnify:CR=1 FL=1
MGYGYNPIVGEKWRYNPEKTFKISRSKIELFFNCSTCFYKDAKLGLRKPPMPGWAINSAVDALLKKEMDICRAKDRPHGIFIENGLDIPANISIHLKSDSRIHFPDGNIVNTTLLPGSNRISLMVEARASGDSQIEVTVYSPDENNLIALESGRILIRTTKLSGVGVFLLIIALGVLIFWWIKSNRVRKTT